ncbi:MAG: hypothetical protein NTW19_22285 [Planctomycetota bacterium]|nr:hypothetical protein [Planctomycetota bacterium]
MMIRQRWRAVATLALACVWAAGAPARAAEPQAQAVQTALNQVPAEAPIVVLMPNLAGLSQKLLMLNDALALKLPYLSDSLAELKMTLGASRGMRDDGPLMIVPTGIGAKAGNEAPPMLVFFPVSDYAAFVGNYNGNPADAVASLVLPGQRPGFARKLEGFALVSPSKQAVEAYKPGNAAAAWNTSLGKLAAPYLASSDAMLLMNVAAMSPRLIPMFTEEMADARARAETADGTPQARASARSAQEMFNGIVMPWLRDTSGALVALEIAEDGVALTTTTQFKPGSPLAAIYGTGGESAPLLGRLANQGFVLAGAINTQGLAVQQIADGLVARAAAGGGGPMVDLLKRAVPIAVGAKGFGTVYYIPQAGGAVGTLLTGVTIMESADAKGLLATCRKFIEDLNDVKVPIAVDAAGAKAGAGAGVITYKTGYLPAFLQMEGVAADQYKVNFELPPSVSEGMGKYGPVVMMLGGSGQGGYLAPTGNYVMMTSVTDSQLVRQALQSARVETGLGTNPLVTQVRGRLTPKPSAEAYLSVQGVVRSINPVMSMLAMPAMTVPADMPPIGAGATLQNNAIAARLFLPTPVLRWVRDMTRPPEAEGAAPPSAK